jgi:hypothetical protein
VIFFQHYIADGLPCILNYIKSSLIVSGTTLYEQKLHKSKGHFFVAVRFNAAVDYNVCSHANFMVLGNGMPSFTW